MNLELGYGNPNSGKIEKIGGKNWKLMEKEKINGWFYINSFWLLSILLIPLIYLILMYVYFYGIKSLGQ